MKPIKAISLVILLAIAARAHATTLGDAFTRADSTNLNAANTGKTLDGSAGTWSWTEVTGNTQVISAAFAGTASADQRARAEQDLASANHYVQVTITSLFASVNRSGGVVGRYDASSDTGYELRLAGNATGAGGTSAFRIAKVVAGTRTDLGSATTVTLTIPATIKLELNGSTLKSYYNGSLVETVTDSSITTGTRTGLFANGSNGGAIEDDFSAADLAATVLYSRGRGVNLGIVRGRGSRGVYQ